MRPTPIAIVVKLQIVLLSFLQIKFIANRKWEEGGWRWRKSAPVAKVNSLFEFLEIVKTLTQW